CWTAIPISRSASAPSPRRSASPPLATLITLVPRTSSDFARTSSVGSSGSGANQTDGSAVSFSSAPENALWDAHIFPRWVLRKGPLAVFAVFTGNYQQGSLLLRRKT